MLYKDGRPDIGNMQPSDGQAGMEKLLEAIASGGLADSIGRMLEAKLRGMTFSGGGQAVLPDEEDKDSLKGIADAMASAKGGIQAKGGSIGKEEEIGGDAGKNKRTIDLIGSI